MKAYLADKIFTVKDFPLMITYAPQTSSMPLHYHDFIEIVLIGQGHSIHNIHSSESQELSYGLIQGDVFSVMPGEVHEYNKSRNLAVYNLALKKEIIANEIGELVKLNSWAALFNSNNGVVRNKIHLPLSERLAAERCLKKMILEFSLKKSGFRLSTKIALLEFLIIVSRIQATEWKASVNIKNTGILESISVMEKASENPFCLSSFAKIAAMSISSYTKKFREATGLSPLDYFIGIRLEKACWLLAETSKSISEIAFDCGFSDPNYMIKLFRLRQGITPAKYRALIRLPVREKSE